VSAYGSAVDRVAKLTLWLCVVALVAAVFLNVVEIGSRYLAGASSLYNVAVSVELVVSLTLIGYLVLLARDEDVTMDYFYMLLPPRGRFVLDLTVAAAIVWFFALLLRASLDYYALSGSMSHPVFPISGAVTSAPVVIAAAACLFVAVYRFIAACHLLVARWNEPPQTQDVSPR